MRAAKTLIIALGVTMYLPTAAQSEEHSAESAQAASAPTKCLKAAVNPVTGHAVCINPRGALVEPPSKEAYQRPCKPRAHDDDPWTVYEHYSGC